MITFDELITLTYNTLNEKGGKGSLSKELVQNILSETGIADFLVLVTEQVPSCRLLIREVAIRGQKWEPGTEEKTPFFYNRILLPGLNAWIAGNSTGKSTILKSILWAITGKKPNFKQDVLEWIDEVYVEVEVVGDDIYTIHYSPRISSIEVSGGIYQQNLKSVIQGREVDLVQGFTGSRAMTDAIDHFFSSRIGFIPLEWLERSADTVNLNRKTISWDVYSQALFISSDDNLDFIFPSRELNGKHHQKTIGMYLGLGNMEVVSRAQMKYTEAMNEYAFEKRRVEVNAIGIRNQILLCQEELDRIEKRLIQIDKEDTVLINPEYAQMVRDRVANINEELFLLSRDRENFVEQERKALADYNQERRNAQGLREAIAFKRFLSGIEVSRCPHCENTIPEIRVEDEIQSGYCRVCHSELKPLASVDHATELLRKTESRVEEYRLDLRRIRKQVKDLDSKIKTVESELKMVSDEYADLARQERAGFDSELRSLIDRKGFLRGQLEQLQIQTEESQKKRLNEIKDRREILRVTLNHLKERVLREGEEIIRKLGEYTTTYSVQFGVRNLEKITLNKQFDLLVQQSGKPTWFPSMDVGERLRIKIAFHLAMLTMRIEDNIGKHPSLLFVDAPGSAEITEEFLDAIISGFENIESRFGDQIQILVASAREELLEICRAEKVEHIPENEPLF